MRQKGGALEQEFPTLNPSSAPRWWLCYPRSPYRYGKDHMRRCVLSQSLIQSKSTVKENYFPRWHFLYICFLRAELCLSAKYIYIYIFWKQKQNTLFPYWEWSVVHPQVTGTNEKSDQFTSISPLQYLLSNPLVVMSCIKNDGLSLRTIFSSTLYVHSTTPKRNNENRHSVAPLSLQNNKIPVFPSCSCSEAATLKTSSLSLYCFLSPAPNSAASWCNWVGPWITDMVNF